MANAPIATIVSRSQHKITSQDIPKGARTVVNGLRQAGFDAFLVGGCVRDLLLSLHPTDFDIVTNARPEQIKEVFPRCRLIGRRFRLAHVRVGREVLEVATYRAASSVKKQAELAHVKGRLVRDNVYGNREQDVQRRDFTINAMFYDCQRNVVLDYLNGFDDLQHKLLRVIGDPQQRYREDPVRMLRALRLAARLDFDLDSTTVEPIPRLGRLLGEVPPARLLDESLKMFHRGFAYETYRKLSEFHVFECLFPTVHRALCSSDGGNYRTMVEKGLRNTDTRVLEGKPVIAPFLFAVLLWGPYRELLQSIERKYSHYSEAMRSAAEQVVVEQNQRISIPRRTATAIFDIWALQRRLEIIRPRSARRMLELQRFRAAYDFLLLRSAAERSLRPQAQWWTDFQEASEAQRNIMLRQLSAPQKRRRRRRKRKLGKRKEIA